MSAFIDLTGKQFNRWFVVSRAGSDSNRHALWLCRCNCGTEKCVDGRWLKARRSGGCRKCRTYEGKKPIHGRSAINDKTYIAWCSMISRCYNTNKPIYRDYGGRGIVVCPRWKNSFQKFIADMGEAPAGLSLDRIDNNGSYEKSNCRWATPREQAMNTRRNRLLDYHGQTMCVSRWSQTLGIKSKTIVSRLRRGWSVEDALGKAIAVESLPGAEAIEVIQKGGG